MSAYDDSVYTCEIADVLGQSWALRFDTAAAIAAELCCRERIGRDMDYLTLAGAASQRVYYALLAIAYGAMVSAARHSGASAAPFDAFERAFPLPSLLAARAAIFNGIYAYLPPGGKKKEPDAQAGG